MTQSLLTLLEQAERARDEGQAALQQAEQAARDLQEQAQQLTQYHSETPSFARTSPPPAGMTYPSVFKRLTAASGS